MSNKAAARGGQAPPPSGSQSDRPLRRDAEANRLRLLEAATAVFAAHGLDAPVEEIAHSAGVGMGTLYRRFPNKAALIDQLVQHLFDQVLEAGRQALEIDGGAGLEIFLRETAALQQAQRGCVSRMWAVPVPATFTTEFDRILTELLARAQEAGLVRSDCAVTDLNLVFWAIRGIMESMGGLGTTAWQRHLDIVLAGLRPGAAPLPHPPLSPDERLEVARIRQGPPR